MEQLSFHCIYCNTENQDNTQSCIHCGRAINSPQGRSSPDSPLLAGRYQILCTVKSGAMGCVYKAQDTHLNNVVALKKMFGSGSESDDSEYLKQRFTEEAALLSQLHHGGLPKVIDFFSAADRETGNDAHYLVMTFIEGEDLETIISERGGAGFSLSEVIGYFRQILTILQYLHSRNPPVIYRDLKPSNIMISKGKLFLVDFGIARIFQPSQKGTAIGTPGYAAPEQFTGYAEPRSDIYSLGAVIHYLVTSVNPEEPTHQLFHFQNPRSLKPETPRHLAALIMSMLETAPEKRPSSVEKIVEELNISEKTDFSMKRVFKKAGLAIAIVAPILALTLAMRSSFDALDSRADIKPPVKSAAKLKRPPPPVDAVTVAGNLPAPQHRPAPSPPPQISISREVLNDSMKARQALVERNLDYSEKTFLEYAGIGDFQAVQLFLASGMNVNARNDKGRTALSLAAQENHFQAVDWLIKKNADINAEDCNHVTVLTYALSPKGPDSAMLLIQNGADISGKNNPILAAVDLGYVDIVKLLVSKKVKLELDDDRGLRWSPLRRALEHDNQEMARILISAGDDVNSRDNSGYTPLHKAAEKGYTEIARMLILKGADVNAKTRKGLTPLCTASMKNATEIMELLMNKGAEVNVKGDHEGTPLHAACINGNLRMVELLISKGANVNAAGGTALLGALAYTHPDIARLLISKGADINARGGSMGYSPLHMSLYSSDKLTSLLVSQGAMINSRSNDGSTPLHVAALNGHPEDIKYLLDHGAEVNAKDNNGRTPLKIAIKGKSAEKITLLRNAGGIE
ncbi:MAG: ankyrin repeat domain-containing protein [Vulcanimicrobiota bacterium]